MPIVNDQQSRLNRTEVSSILCPHDVGEIEQALQQVRSAGRSLAVAGGRHAMGGQQFAAGELLVDMRGLNRVLHFDRERGQIRVESGIMWPELVAYLHQEQDPLASAWAIRQKQSGVDQVTIGGSLAANIHGRGLTFPPFISDIISFNLLDAQGCLQVCSRTENQTLFSLAIGGYGLFGVVTEVVLQLVPRCKVRRVVEIISVCQLLDRFAERIDQGFLYGDCQYAIDFSGNEQEHHGVFSCYQPVDPKTPIPLQGKQLSANDWADLYRLSRCNKAAAFDRFAQYYLSTSGQVYWSDIHQFSLAFTGYDSAVDAHQGTEMITEVYIPHQQLRAFLRTIRADCKQHQFDITYGTMRLIAPDHESFLAWAREPLVCIICNLHVRSGPEGISKAQHDFRRILDRTVAVGGSFFLTYHRWATQRHLDLCYPQLRTFLQHKSHYDPQDTLHSDWYRHTRALLG